MTIIIDEPSHHALEALLPRVDAFLYAPGPGEWFAAIANLDLVL